MSRAVFEVVPVDDAWLIRMAGDSVAEIHASKTEAIQRARELGHQYDEWRVRVLSQNGRVESELSSTEPLRP
jgi:hypothetical protein